MCRAGGCATVLMVSYEIEHRFLTNVLVVRAVRRIGFRSDFFAGRDFRKIRKWPKIDAEKKSGAIKHSRPTDQKKKPAARLNRNFSGTIKGAMGVLFLSWVIVYLSTRSVCISWSGCGIKLFLFYATIFICSVNLLRISGVPIKLDIIYFGVRFIVSCMSLNFTHRETL